MRALYHYSTALASGLRRSFRSANSFILVNSLFRLIPIPSRWYPCVLFLLSLPMAYANQGEIKVFRDFPVGLWEAKFNNPESDTDNEDKDPLAGKGSIRIHIHNVGAKWGELQFKNEFCAGEIESVPYTRELDEFDDCLEEDTWRFQHLADGSIMAYRPRGSFVKFQKSKKNRIPKLEKLKGVWESKVPESNGEVVTLEVQENGVGFVSTSDTESKFTFHSDSAGAIFLVNSEWDDHHQYLPIKTINQRKMDVYTSSGELQTFRKTRQDPSSRLIVDDYGRSMELNFVSVDARIYGSIAETVVDVEFTNRNPNADEAQFSLPIPSDAVVTGYKLDVENEMVPGVAIPKSEAQDVFETLQNRGIDPGLAKVSQSNQFSTEVYPIEYGDSRRIQVSYVEVLPQKSNNNSINYAFPIHKFGKMQAFSLNITAVSDKKPTIRPLKTLKNSDNKRIKFTKSKKGYGAHANYLSSQFKSPISVKLRATPTNQTIFENHNGELFYLISGMVESHNQSDSRDTINIIWDTSLSMEKHHHDYAKIIRKIRKKYRRSTISINQFNLFHNESFKITPRTSKNRLDNFIESISYGGASDMSNIKKLLNRGSSHNILFSDGMNTSGKKYHIDDLENILVFHPDNVAINKPLLNQISISAGIFPVTKNNTRTLVDQLSRRSPGIEVTGDNGVYVVQPQLHTDRFLLSNTIEGNKLPLKLSIKQDGQTIPITLSDQDIVFSQLGDYIQAQNQLAPLLVSPRDHREKIKQIGMQYHLSTPYTTLIVLESVEDYAQFGIEPPAIMDPLEEYDELREEWLEDETGEKQRHLNDLVRAWENRLQWWKTGDVIGRSDHLYLGVTSCLGEDGIDQLCTVEEVVVTGIRASLAQANVFLEPWVPDAPYMKKIIHSNPKQWRKIYEVERNNYKDSMPFYMDMAKFFYDRNKPVDGTRILSNILEIFPEKPRMERLVAYILQENGQEEYALEIFELLNEIAPYQASSKRDLALIYKKIGLKNSDAQLLSKALKLFYQAATESSDDPFELPVTAVMELNHLIGKIRHYNIDTSWIDKRLLGEMDLDLRITLSWTNEFSMVDLYVTEPSGEEVEWKDRTSELGAWLPYDSWGNGPVEYLLKKSVPGEFQTKAVYWSDDDIEGFSPIGVRVDFYINYGRPNEQHISSVIRLENVNEEYIVGKVVIPKISARDKGKGDK